jgi:hypothetical protein
MRSDSYEDFYDHRSFDEEPLSGFLDDEPLPSTLFFNPFNRNRLYDHYTIYNSNLGYFAYAEYCSRTIFMFNIAYQINYIGHQRQRRLKLRGIFLEYALYVIFSPLFMA